GIRSFDGLRYWYYAHFRQNRPYAEGLEVGRVVLGGDVIGYVGRTGYSSRENSNNIKQSHLHVGLQLCFDRVQRESDNEIWVDLYAITRLLSAHRSAVVRNDETKEYTRAFGYQEVVPEDRFVPPA
ncbi:MAG: M23 family metallopeptidase, partial [Clostridia bacterium]|nr:M23 family metallopeptidase [Clostridia bacterium]